MNPALHTALVDIEAHVATSGWDSPPRLYALVETGRLLLDEPGLADQLGMAGLDPDQLPTWTPVEQEGFAEGGQGMDRALAGIAWPDAVGGVALAVERLMLPPSAEAVLPADPAAAAQFVAEHPDRQEVRIVVAVLRDGSRDALVRTRRDDAQWFGPDLVPGLAQALAATLLD